MTEETPQSQETALAPPANKKEPPQLMVGARGVMYRNYDEMWRFANAIARAGEMCPTNFRNKPEAVMVALQMGSEVGLSPMFAIRNIAVIHGRASIWGDAFLGVVRHCPGWAEDGYKEWYDGEGDAYAAYCQVRRGTGQPQVGTFSIEDAKQAKLWDPDGSKSKARGDKGPGTWTNFPKDMLMWRARTRVMRRVFADSLAGLTTREEAMDIPPETTAEPEFVDQPALPAPTTSLGKVQAATAKAKKGQDGAAAPGTDSPDRTPDAEPPGAAPDPTKNVVSKKTYDLLREAWGKLEDEVRDPLREEYKFSTITDVKTKKWTEADATDFKIVVEKAVKEASNADA